MFSSKAAMFISTQSPVHMGAGVAVGGIIDNPIQRETHTQYPYFAASGIKGALRQHLSKKWQDKGLIKRIFGPDSGASDHAGALSFSDASLVTFPVQSLKNSFVYATCPTVLARTRRALAIAGIEDIDWEIPTVAAEQALSVSPDLLSDKKFIILETFKYDAVINKQLKVIADWLAAHAFPQDTVHSYFSEKISNDLVLVTDEDFLFFVENATSIEPHVKIDDKTGTAQDGALFYSENLPPESILLSTVMTSVERYKDKPEEPMQSGVILDHVTGALNGTTVQIGGDSTTGRGIVTLNIIGGAV